MVVRAETGVRHSEAVRSAARRMPQRHHRAAPFLPINPARSIALRCFETAERLIANGRTSSRTAGLAARKPPKDGSAGGIDDSGEGGSDAVNRHRG